MEVIQEKAARFLRGWDCIKETQITVDEMGVVLDITCNDGSTCRALLGDDGEFYLPSQRSYAAVMY